MKKAFLLLTVFITWYHTFSQTHSPEAKYKLVSVNNYVLSKNYYLLTLLSQDADVKRMLEEDTALVRLLHYKSGNLTNTLKDCSNKVSCYTEQMKLSEVEINTFGNRLSALYSDNNAFGKLVTRQLIPSGTYVLFKNLSPKELLVKAWEQDAKAVNYAIAVYGEGAKANYPNIDSISFNVRDKRYPFLLYDVAYTVINECKSNRLFFVPSLTSALHFLQINEREQAADYEPMTAGVNKAAFDRVKSIKWNDYKYSVIVVPGAGPEEPDVALSAEGMLRSRLAALQYQKGMAPFIVVSGGKVHPFKTKYCEAIEMKKYMTERLNIPENAVIVEPHARHTTTNMRNAARLIYRYGIPFSKPGITCTTRGQSNMITNTLSDRCMAELNEVPFKNGQRLSESEVEFYPLIEALQINPMEPLDP